MPNNTPQTNIHVINELNDVNEVNQPNEESEESKIDLAAYGIKIKPKKMFAASHLIWVDMEMTGLDPKIHKVLEIAIIITDAELNFLAQSEAIAIHQPTEALALMDKWNVKTHTNSGLLARVQASTHNEATATECLLDFLKPYTKASTHPMCGNSICQDRRFMYEHMPLLEAYFHYRNVDVSTIKELAKRWNGDLVKGFVKKQAHTAVADILESIEELKYYRQHIWQLENH